MCYAALGLSVLAGCAEREEVLPGVREPVDAVLQRTDAEALSLITEDDNQSREISLPAQETNSSAQQFEGSPDFRTLHPALGQNLSRVWSVNIGRGDERKQRITADPVVGDGLIYTLDAGTTVTAVSTSGDIVWQSKINTKEDDDDEATGGGLALDAGTLYVSSGFGILTALDGATGATIWEQQLEATGSGRPLVAGGFYCKDTNMRIVPILMAVLVAVLILAFVLERDALTAMLGGPATASQTPAETETAPEIVTPEPSNAALIKVVAKRSVAQSVDSAVILRGQTEAARQVDVRAETNSTVISDPLRKGVFVEKDDLLCRLDPGTRQASLAEARARLTEAQARQSEAASRVPEAEARLNEASARLDEALTNQNVARQLSQDGFAAETRGQERRRGCRGSRSLC